jgi:hypothetical protein
MPCPRHSIVLTRQAGVIQQVPALPVFYLYHP